MKSPAFKYVLLVTTFAFMLSGTASAQQKRLPEGTPLPDYAKVYPVPEDRGPVILSRNGLPNIMVTGYWPPTNEMIRRFSSDPIQNPDGWIGEDWEGRGYNIYSFFPEFPEGLGKGEGDFEVDYQDTSADFWDIVAQVEPIAIVTTGRADDDLDWELEGGHRMFPLAMWMDDYLEPYDPTPELPIADEPDWNERYSTLPMQAIVDAVEAQVPAVDAYSTELDTSSFLCNFVGYHATWYHDLHSDPDDPLWLIASGHIHVGSLMSDLLAFEATKVTLRTLTDYLDVQQSVFPPAPESGGPPCTTAEDCTGAWTGADCVAGTCYVPKNRYLSIDPTVNTPPVAYQVEITEAVDYPDAEGRTWWVDEPVCYDYPNGEPVLPAPPTCEGADRFGWVSTLTETAVTRVWVESPVNIADCGIAPVIVYAIRASTDGGAIFSGPLEINTIHAPLAPQYWGDVTGGPESADPPSGYWLAPDGSAGMGDVQAAIRTFENRSADTGFPPRIWIDVEIDRVISMGDIQFIIKAFEATAYADLLDLEFIGFDPVDCP